MQRWAHHTPVAQEVTVARCGMTVVVFMDVFYIYLLVSCLEVTLHPTPTHSLPAALTTLQVFDCYQQPDGTYSLRAQASIDCFGGEWSDLVVLSALGLGEARWQPRQAVRADPPAVVYGMGLPAIYYYALRIYDGLAQTGMSHEEMYSTHPWIGYFKFIWQPVSPWLQDVAA